MCTCHKSAATRLLLWCDHWRSPKSPHPTADTPSRFCSQSPIRVQSIRPSMDHKLFRVSVQSPSPNPQVGHTTGGFLQHISDLEVGSDQIHPFSLCSPSDPDQTWQHQSTLYVFKVFKPHFQNLQNLPLRFNKNITLVKVWLVLHVSRRTVRPQRLEH